LAVRILNLNFIQNSLIGCTTSEAAQKVEQLNARRYSSEEDTLDLIKKSIKNNYLFLTVDEFKKLLLDNLDQYPLVWIDERNPVKLMEFLFGLRSGTYVIASHKRVKSFEGIVKRNFNN
jgi:hypothetical protein